MNVLSRTREEVQKLVEDGWISKSMLKHYDLCKAIASGMTQEQAADKFNLTDDRYVRKIKSKKCPDCNKIQ